MTDMLTYRHNPKIVLYVYRRPTSITLVDFFTFQSQHLRYARPTYVNVQQPNLKQHQSALSLSSCVLKEYCTCNWKYSSAGYLSPLYVNMQLFVIHHRMLVREVCVE